MFDNINQLIVMYVCTRPTKRRIVAPRFLVEDVAHSVSATGQFEHANGQLGRTHQNRAVAMQHGFDDRNWFARQMEAHVRHIGQQQHRRLVSTTDRLFIDNSW